MRREEWGRGSCSLGLSQGRRRGSRLRVEDKEDSQGGQGVL